MSCPFGVHKLNANRGDDLVCEEAGESVCSGVCSTTSLQSV